MTNKDEDEAFEHEMSAHPWGYGQRRDQTFEFAMAAIRHRGLWAEATVVMKEIERLKAERDALQANAEKGTEYVLAHINQDLKAERDALLGILKDALSHAEWSEKIIYPFVGEDFQSWRLTVFLGVPLSESDKSPEAALERTISAAIDAARGKT